MWGGICNSENLRQTVMTQDHLSGMSPSGHEAVRQIDTHMVRDLVGRDNKSFSSPLGADKKQVQPTLSDLW